MAVVAIEENEADETADDGTVRFSLINWSLHCLESGMRDVHKAERQNANQH